MILNKQLCLAAVILICVLLWSSCKKCSDGTGNTYNVDQAELPYIIPYSDTSKVRFLKNGIDTLTFISQGLKNTYISQNVPGDGCSQTDKLQQFSLKMKCNESEFFEIINGPISSDNEISIQINNTIFDNIFFVKNNLYDQNKTLKNVFINNITIANTSYDSLTKISLKDTTTYFLFKGKIGMLKYRLNNNIYELIK